MELDNDEAVQLAGHLGLWFKAFRRTGREKTEILISYADGFFPETAGVYKDFMNECRYWDEKSSWVLLDFLLAFMEKEIMDYTANEIDVLMQEMNESLSRTAMIKFTKFLGFIEPDGENGWKYQIGWKTRADKESGSAYSFRNFSRMAYCIFNDQFITEKGILEKAANDGNAANLWLYLALHFISALRSSDFERIVCPEIQTTPVEARKRILSGDIKWTDDALKELEIYIAYQPLSPGKTARYKNIPDLKIFIPESLRGLMGVMIALAASWRNEEGSRTLVKRNTSAADIRKVFGADFVEALGGLNFSTRRANKSYSSSP